MINEYQLRVLPQEGFDEDSIAQYVSREKGIDGVLKL